MTRILERRLRRMEGRLRQQLAQRAPAPAADAPADTQQVARAALKEVSSEDLQILSTTSITDLSSTAATAECRAVLRRYYVALQVSSMKLTGNVWLGRELPVSLAGTELQWRSRHKLYTRFPDRGPLRRELYPKHLEFFRSGAEYTERCFMAGNRVGKTEAAAYELTLHLTGWYPHWWEGRRFAGPVTAWAAGETTQTVRDILQEKLLGPRGARGTGMIPAEHIQKVTAKPGLAEAVDTIQVRHERGGISSVQLKSYQEGRESYQGVGIDVVWLDEEAPESIYIEALTRLMTTHGILMLTFTPLKGLTPVVLRFLPKGTL